MTASEMTTQYQALAGFQALTAVIWAVCALTAFSGYRTYRRRLDLGWAVAFCLLALTQALDAYASYGVAREFHVLTAGQAGLLELSMYYHLRSAAFAMVAAFVMLYAFRQRHTFSRTTELT